MAIGNDNLEELLSGARKHELEFNWLKAVDKYEVALSLQEAKDGFTQGTILDSISYARFKAALQSGSPEEFKVRIGKAIESCQKAVSFFDNCSDLKGKAWAKRCEATLAYLGFWQATDRKRKWDNLSKVWGLARDSLDGYDIAKDGLEYCKTYLRLSMAGQMALFYIRDFQERSEISAGSMAAGEKAIGFAQGIGDSGLSALIYARTACIVGTFWVEFERNWQDLQLMNRSLEYWFRASEICEAALYDEFLAQAIMSVPHLPVNLLSRESRPFMVKALERARETGDGFQIGCVLATLAEFVSLDMYAAASDTELDDIFRMSVQYARDSKDCFAIILWPTFAIADFWIPDPELFPNATRADVEVDLCEKREYAAKASEYVDAGISLAEASGCIEHVLTARDNAGYALSSLARSEREPRKRRDLLERALRHRKEAMQLTMTLHPLADATIGYNLATLSELEFELHLLASSTEEKRKILEDAVQHMDTGRQTFHKTITEAPSTESQLRGDYTHVLEGRWASCLGAWLIALYGLTQDRKLPERAIQAFEAALDCYAKADLPSRRAEIFWEIARTRSLTDDHSKASDNFLRASDEFETAGKKVLRLRRMCEDYSAYMRAWAEIEQARHSQFRQDYGLARTHYDKAAELHSMTEKWGYLSVNYLAWAQVECGEDLSRNDDSVGAARSFRLATELFAKSVEMIRHETKKIEDVDERRMAEALVRVAAVRQKYCDARVVLEEAKDLEKKGQGHLCSEKYGKVATMLQDIQSSLETDQDKKEIELILTLTKAWQAMCKADAEESSDSYSQASVLFEKAKELSSGERARLMAMGHSRFCKALEAGTRFTDSGDSAYHAAAAQHLESAANYYLKAGLEGASMFANASKLLFDGYVYMGDASKEKDQSKRAKLYATAEKVLLASASAYSKAGYPGKKDHLEKLLAKVKRDKELAVSLTDVFSAPDIVSTTMAFSSPMSTHETAVGLDRFEHADVQATLVAGPESLPVGENFSLAVELVNAGRGPAQLIKLQDPVPEGFTLVEEPEGYRMEDSYLNLKGKRLDPLKTEEIKLVLKSMSRGQFNLRPRVLYLDESGRYKSHEPEPMRLTVGADAAVLKKIAVPSDPREAAEARSLLAGLNVVTLSHYRIVGNYVRFGGEVCNALKDARQKIVAACSSASPKRENYVIWAPPGSGKTYFVQEVASLLGNSVHYCELNLAKLDEAGFRSGLAGLRDIQKPCLCLVDEADAKPDEPWPYEALLPFLDASATEGARFVFVLAGSSGSSLEEMKKAIASRPKGSDVLSRVPAGNEYAIPPMGVGDRLLVVLSQFRQAGKQMGHEVREVEKLGLYYVALNPRLANARQLREFAVRCAERVLPGDDRLKYDSLFQPGDLENKLFWASALRSARVLVDSFLLVED